MLLIEMLEHVLGDEPTDIELWKATNRGRDGLNLALALVECYRSSFLEPLPKKSVSDFRPAFLVDYEGRGNTPYDREFAFVARALSYADQVAVVDEVARWSALLDPAAELRARQFEGFVECNDITWRMRRIARYGVLERAQLLYYVDAPSIPSRADEANSLAQKAVFDLRDLVEQRKSWSGAADFSIDYRNGLATGELSMWFAQLAIVLEQVQAHHQHIDLYLPEWFAGPELLEWTYRHVDSPSWLTARGLHDQRALSTMVDLPAPSAALIDRLSSTDLLGVRNRDHMAKWRNSVRSDIERLSAGGDLAARLEVHESLQRHAEQLRTDERKSSGLADGLSEAVGAGVAVVPAALATGQDWVGAAATSASPAILTLTRNLYNWLFQGDSNGPSDARNRSQESNAIRMFMSEPALALGSAHRRPPESWMRTQDGRPIAFDIMNLFSEGRE